MAKGNPNKSYLPSKLCVVCGRPFSWRKKWAHNWEQVKYCSNRCRQHPSGHAVANIHQHL